MACVVFVNRDFIRVRDFYKSRKFVSRGDIFIVKREMPILFSLNSESGPIYFP